MNNKNTRKSGEIELFSKSKPHPPRFVSILMSDTISKNATRYRMNNDRHKSRGMHKRLREQCSIMIEGLVGMNYEVNG